MSGKTRTRMIEMVFDDRIIWFLKKLQVSCIKLDQISYFFTDFMPRRFPCNKILFVLLFLVYWFIYALQGRVQKALKLWSFLSLYDI